MKSFALTAISAALLAAASTATHANFIDDSTLDIKLRNVAFDVDTKGSDGDWREWSQALELNLKSGYFADTIGFDASYYGAMALDHQGDSQYSSTYERGQLLGQDNGGYNKLGQAYVKAKLGDENQGAYGQVGYMRGKNGLILGSSSRSTPASYRGALAEGYIMNGWMVHAGYVDQIGQRTEESWDKLVTQNGTTIDYVWQVGSIYDANNLHVEGHYLESEDYVKQYTGTLAYTFDLTRDMSLMLEGMYFGTKENGKKWDNNGFDDDAHHYTLTSELNVQDATFALTYAHTKAEREGSLGFQDDRFAYNDYGATPSRVSRYYNSFWYDGEKVWQLEGTYDFSNTGLPGLSTSLVYTQGKDMKDPTADNMEKETETDLIVKYAIDEGTFKGLSFSLIKAWAETEYGGKSNEKAEHIRAYIDYTVSVF